MTPITPLKWNRDHSCVPKGIAYIMDMNSSLAPQKYVIDH